LLGTGAPSGEVTEPGMILIQIDGLSRTQFERALKNNRLPFLASLIRDEHFTLDSFYSGIPSTTPAVQGELFFGVKTAVPAFHFLRRRSGRELRMFEAESAEEIENELLASCPNPLLEGAHTYSNIYRAGAARSRYCSRDLAPDEILRRLHPLKWLVLGVFYFPKLLRIAFLAVVELGLALADAMRGLYKHYDFVKEMTFVPARIAVCIVLREAIRFRMLLDVERGVRTIHANFLGYDEQAHRRGPDSAFAHWTLKGIDQVIRDVHRAMNGSDYRDYEMIVYSDHGQERATPYIKKYDRPLEEAIKAVFAHGPLGSRKIWAEKTIPLLGSSLDRCRAFLGLHPNTAKADSPPDPAEQIIVAAMGPLGHLYVPNLHSEEDRERYATALVKEANIPLVLLPSKEGVVRAFNQRGSWMLPQDHTEILGADHPFLEEAAEDMVRLCRHPDAGDLIISGWDPTQPLLTFASENGAHGGPGYEETRGFLLLPDRIRKWHVAHLPRTHSRVRANDLRKIVLHFLGRDGEREERVREWDKSESQSELRVMSYNIHTCAGIDGKIRPERVARVINHFDPDVVAIQEIDCHRFRSGGHDQAEVIAHHLRMRHVFHALFEEEKERYGIAIFSKHPIEVIKADYLTEAEPSRRREARGAIWVKLDVEGLPPTHFINTHFGLNLDEKRRQVDTLLGPDWLGGIGEDEAIILCGDFNSGPRSAVFHSLTSRLNDAQQNASNWKPRATFSSYSPLFRIDHVFFSGHFNVKSVQVPTTATAMVASDHLPICVELTPRPANENS